MYTRLLSLTLLVVVLSSASVRAQTTRTIDRTFELATDGTVTVDTYKGHVDVTTWDQSRARVSVRIEGKSSSVEKTKIHFDASQDRLEVETDYDDLEKDRKLFGLIPYGSIDRPATHYTLTLPRSSSVTLDTYSAGASVSGVGGAVHFDAYSGNLTATDVGGPVHVDSYSGDVELTRSRGTVAVDTYSGDLRADSLSGPVEFSAYSGSAVIGFARLTDECRFDTFSGDVTLTLPRDSGGVIETSRDAFESDLPITIERRSDDRVRARFGGGGPRLRFESFSGSLSVRGQDAATQ